MTYHAPLCIAVASRLLILAVAAGFGFYAYWSRNNNHNSNNNQYSNNNESLQSNYSSKLRKTCSICLEDLTGYCVELPCKHKYHPECIRQLIIKEEQRRCAFCRKEIPEEHLSNLRRSLEQSNYSLSHSSNCSSKLCKTCSICLEDLTGYCVELPCKHKYHPECIRQLIIKEEQRRCAFCCEEIPKEYLSNLRRFLE